MSGIFTWLIGTPTGRTILAVIAALALAADYTLYVYDSGKSAAKADDLKASIHTQEKIDNAEAHGPRSPSDVDKRLRDHSF